MLGASPYPLSVARLAFNLTKVRKVRIIVLSQRAITTKGVKMLKFQNLHQCPQCADFVSVGVNVSPASTDWITLDWVCQDCSKEWEI